MSAERITRREMLKRLIVAPIGAAVLTTLEVRQASAATMQPYYDPYFVAVLWEGRTRCDSLWRSLKGDVVPVLPTVQGTTPYDRLYWTGYALGSAPVNVNMRVLARGRPQRRTAGQWVATHRTSHHPDPADALVPRGNPRRALG